ncbi:TPA: hypothetical protein QEM76_003595 [Pseudomonas putida]|uniref:Uncharacterized protein n=1 Tax=Pseudomonas fortuita TaxID=3233375 RepID=A0ACD4P6W4_9PSED|nr:MULTISPECIES: hypothetical protein [Pseudomonas]MCA4077057.1 hypothetical protein [Pseudomonas kurunegalensis]MCI1020692.1 hypothetical protein [Pseudomonas putida]WAP63673.1 hypothetical protein OZ911_28015 [Pseudomonas putida]HDS1800402.1 hypothetical protein [Pseudomonas putida]HDS1806868.1 hypothetical protein [Pseudomonas putida]
MSKAEQGFREAFERLKRGQPLRVPQGLPLSQNLVAKEAGNDPSALKKARFPSLVAEIQHWVNNNAPQKEESNRQAAKKKRQQNRSYRERIEELKVQRDSLASLLLEADAKILELTQELANLRASPLPQNVTRLR